MECEWMLTGNSVSDIHKIFYMVSTIILVSLCHLNMLFIDCDHEPVSGLSKFSKTLGNYKVHNGPTDIPYGCVDYL